jgi:ketosteroid isomerase-like protein
MTTQASHPAHSEAKQVQEQLSLDTFNRHVASFQRADIDGVISDFADDAIVITPEGIFEGKDKIRSVYQALFDEFGNMAAGDSPGIELDDMHTRGNLLFITWHAVSRKHEYPFGTDTFIINDNLIKRQTIAYAAPQIREE